MPNTPARDSIERALTQAAQNGLIKSWERMPGYGPHAKWAIHLTPGAVGPDGTGRIEVRTYNEAHLICAVLASSRLGFQPRLDAYAEKLDRYRERAGLEPGDDDTEYFGTPDERVLDGMRDAHRDRQEEWLSLSLVAEYAGMQDAQAAGVLAGLAAAGQVEKQGRGTTAAAWKLPS